MPIKGVPEVRAGDDLVSLLLSAAARYNVKIENEDVLVIKQKVVSKAEGMVLNLDTVKPDEKARDIAREQKRDPRVVEIVLRESKRIIKIGDGVIITQTRHGFVCLNAGLDRSNVEKNHVALLPDDSDRSAREIRKKIRKTTGKKVAVIITDTFSRPWRKGQVDFAIGYSGIGPLLSYIGQRDNHGNKLKVTETAIADEIAAAAELVSGKLSRVPIVVVRGLRYRKYARSIRQLLVEPEKDLFRLKYALDKTDNSVQILNP